MCRGTITTDISNRYSSYFIDTYEDYSPYNLDEFQDTFFKQFEKKNVQYSPVFDIGLSNLMDKIHLYIKQIYTNESHFYINTQCFENVKFLISTYKLYEKHDFIFSIIYLNKLLYKSSLKITKNNYVLFYFILVNISSKFNNDISYGNKTLSQLLIVDVKIINKYEADFLKILDWKLNVKVDRFNRVLNCFG